jgi:hypothetical protein
MLPVFDSPRRHLGFNVECWHIFDERADCTITDRFELLERMAKIIQYSDEGVLVIHKEVDRAGAAAQINRFARQARAPRFDSRDEVGDTCGQLGVGGSAACVVLILHVVDILIGGVNEVANARHPLYLCGGRNKIVHPLEGLQETVSNCPVLG